MIKKSNNNYKKKKKVDNKNIKTEPHLRFCPLGGFEEIGRNCVFFEYENEIVVVDMGIQFPEEETPGIDYIIPNTTYLEPKKKNIKGLILTHGHYDHIHAIPYLIERLGNPIIYTAPLTKALVEKRLEEFPNLPKPKFHIVKQGDNVNISEHFKAKFFDIGHTIPDGVGFIMDTPAGNMVHFGDFRIERRANGEAYNLENFKKLGEMDVHTAFLDSTNADVKGKSTSEDVVEENLEKLIKQAKGRIIIATFSSLLTRLAVIFKIAAKLNKKVAVNGRSMKNNVQIAKNLGYIKAPKNLLINTEDTKKYDDNKIVILTTGGQGEPNAGLTKIAAGQHKHIRFKENDTIIFSSSIVPGNERSVQMLQDNIARQVDEVYNSKLLDIHASGHSPEEDLALVMELVKPKFVVPANAYYFKRKACAKIANDSKAVKNGAILIDNGQVCKITKDDFKVSAETVPASYVMVDGLGVGDVEEVVLRDRLMLSAEGMVVVISTINKQTGKLLKNPDIISRGFIFLKENKDLLDEIRVKLRSLLNRIPFGQRPDPDYIKGLIRDQIGQLLYKKTKRRPMILPVIIRI
jgi:ribonuclease J